MKRKKVNKRKLTIEEEEMFEIIKQTRELEEDVYKLSQMVNQLLNLQLSLFVKTTMLESFLIARYGKLLGERNEAE